VRILFVLHHAGVTPFARTLGLLAERGHQVHVAFKRVKTAESARDLKQLADEFPAITFGHVPGGRRSEWDPLARKLRATIDYLRYLEPRYRDAGKLRARAERNAPAAGRRLAGVARTLGRPGVAAALGTLQRIERCLPAPVAPIRHLAAHDYDLLLITPLIELGSSQSDWLRAAKRLGIRTGYPVLSWDNLTNKGLLRDVPDRVFVWNEVQAGEAVELHGVPRDRVVVTGAQPFDHWFEWEPSRSREEFCAEVGLPADRPFAVYVCSSGFVAPDEPEFVRRWIAELRAHGGPLAEAGILVRPHPLFAAQWDGAELDDLRAVIWPRHDQDPSDEAGRRNYFDSIHHSAAMVGINTTAQIEGAIVGRPVHTVLADDFRFTQEGTLHFHYLEDGSSGELIVGRTFAEHAAQLEQSLRGDVDPGRNERFLRWFVRPLGLDVSGSEQLAGAIEELGRQPAPLQDRGPLLRRPVRFALRPFARAAARRAEEQRRRRHGRRGPEHHLERRARNVARHASRSPVVAGPWLGDEVGELLYWIPYLRWAQVAFAGLHDRLFVLRRRSSAWWYEDLGAHLVDAEEIVDSEALPAVIGVEADRYLIIHWEEVESRRGALAAHKPDRRIQRRLLEFEPLAPPADAAIATPSAPFVAVRAIDLGRGLPVVRLDGLDPVRAAGLIAQSACYAGTYGSELYTAALLGRPAVAVRAPDDPVVDRDLRLASYFLGRPPFGRLDAVTDAGSARAAVASVLERMPAASALTVT
jgi:hypothetical protein